ncbi:MAG: prephenate dehydratase [Rhodospirillaceae bacterium]|nr:prephenate dehydratase [Rhodospirillaceae bacterium]
MSKNKRSTVAFQGVAGAYSDLACREAFPENTTLPCPTFADTFAAVEEQKAKWAMIPIENSVAGRVADIHQMLPHSGLHFVAEHFQRIHHQLLGIQGTKIENIKKVYSHVHALSQCHKILREFGIEAVVHADTAGAAAEISAQNDRSVGAIASILAAKTYGLEILKSNIEDEDHNTTRFILLAKQPIDPGLNSGPVVTSFVFRVRNVPAALHKALGGFATNGINMTKLESYMVGGTFTATQFYAEVEAHPKSPSLENALEELAFFSREVRIMGVFSAHPFRSQLAKKAN